MLSCPRFATALLAGLLSAAPALAEIEVHDAFVRATPPGSTVSAAFMRLDNTGGEEITLTGVRADRTTTVELHTHGEQDGVMQMRRIDAIKIPGRNSHRLQPGGDHLMLIGLTQPLVEGESVELTLEFSFDEPVKVSVPVLSPESELETEIEIRSH